MNKSTAIFLINDEARAIKAVYDDGQKADIFKTLDQDIKVDDLVVVESSTRHGFTVCKVTEVDVDIDLESSAPVKWIVRNIDLRDYEGLVEQEGQALKAIQSAQLRQKREALRDALFADHAATLKALPIASMNDKIAKE